MKMILLQSRLQKVLAANPSRVTNLKYPFGEVSALEIDGPP